MMRPRWFVALVACAVASAWSLTALAQESQEKPQPKREAKSPEQKPPQLTEQEMILRSSTLSGLTVTDPKSMRLGKLDNLIIDAHTGQVLYGILKTRQDDKFVPVPWAAFRLFKDVKDNRYYLSLNMSRDHLASAPTVDKERMPDFTNQPWKESVDKFFGVRTAARPTEQKR